MANVGLSAFVTSLKRRSLGNLSEAIVPSFVVDSIIKAASLFAAGKSVATEAISVKVATLTKGGLKAMLLTKFKTVTAVAVAVAATTIAYGMMADVKGGKQDKEPGTAPVAVREDKPLVPATPERPKGAGPATDAEEQDKGEYKELRGRWRVVWEEISTLVGNTKGQRQKNGPMIWSLKGVKSPEQTKVKIDGASDAVYFQLSPDAKKPGQGKVAPFNWLMPYTIDPPDPRITSQWMTMPGVYGWVGENRIRLCIPLSQFRPSKGDEPTKLPKKLMDRGTKGYISCELERVDEKRKSHR